MNLSENFTLIEYTKSQTATRKGINNSIEDQKHLVAAATLFQKVIQKVRNRFGVTIVTSGYRSPMLNKAIGGSKSSQHCYGQACDIEVPGVSNIVVAEWIRDNLDFDQLILEFYTPGIPNSGWVHVSFVDNKENRNNVLTATRIDDETVYTLGINS